MPGGSGWRWGPAAGFFPAAFTGVLNKAGAHGGFFFHEKIQLRAARRELFLLPRVLEIPGKNFGAEFYSPWLSGRKGGAGFQFFLVPMFIFWGARGTTAISSFGDFFCFGPEFELWPSFRKGGGGIAGLHLRKKKAGGESKGKSTCITIDFLLRGFGFFVFWADF